MRNVSRRWYHNTETPESERLTEVYKLLRRGDEGIEENGENEDSQTNENHGKIDLKSDYSDVMIRFHVAGDLKNIVSLNFIKFFFKKWYFQHFSQSGSCVGQPLHDVFFCTRVFNSPV